MGAQMGVLILVITLAVGLLVGWHSMSAGIKNPLGRIASRLKGGCTLALILGSIGLFLLLFSDFISWSEFIEYTFMSAIAGLALLSLMMTLFLTFVRTKSKG